MLCQRSNYVTSKIISFPNRKNGKFMNFVSAHGKIYDRIISFCSWRKSVYYIISKAQKCSANHQNMHLEKFKIFQTE
jgi:hypothetical protein